MNLDLTSFNLLFVSIKFPLIGIMIAMFLAGWFVSKAFGWVFSKIKLEKLLYSVEKDVETKIDKATESVKEAVIEIKDAVGPDSKNNTEKKTTQKKTTQKKD